MNEWFETHPFLKQMRRRLSVELAVCLLLFCGVFLAARYAGLASAGADAVLGKKKPVVFLDAGHGDFDPGKVSVDGRLEKDINLALALKLRDKFKQDSIRIILTRDSDIGLYSEGNTNKKAEDMQNRCKIITEAAPIFTVSLHQNSYPSPEVCGAQVFYFGQSQDGKKLADTIQDSLIANVDPDNHRVAKANESYYLLKKTPTPTVIVECGFLSNPTEADLLLTDDYQNKLVNAIYIGIQNYLSESM